eukprot:767277-Hanusia_phi.AAC.5
MVFNGNLRILVTELKGMRSEETRTIHLVDETGWDRHGYRSYPSSKVVSQAKDERKIFPKSGLTIEGARGDSKGFIEQMNKMEIPGYYGIFSSLVGRVKRARTHSISLT